VEAARCSIKNRSSYDHAGSAIRALDVRKNTATMIDVEIEAFMTIPKRVEPYATELQYTNAASMIT
jgi:hypothetical protein